MASPTFILTSRIKEVQSIGEFAIYATINYADYVLSNEILQYDNEIRLQADLVYFKALS